MIPIIYKGGDKEINIALKYGGSSVPISDILDITVSVYQTKSEIIQQWKVSNGSIEVVDDAGGLIRMYLDRDNTINIPAKRIYMNIVFEFTNSSLESSIQKVVQSDIVLADLKYSIND